jgi:hypothetical protein
VSLNAKFRPWFTAKKNLDESIVNCRWNLILEWS